MKKFLIIGNMCAIGYQEIFPLIKDNKMWLGTQYVKEFISDDGGIKKFGNIMWYTNMEHNKRNEPLILTKKYDPALYPKYDNYDAIEVGKVKDIPMDYDGVMGVPITFLEKYSSNQFEIKGLWNDGKAGEEIGATYCEAISAGKIISWNGPTINRQTKYFRILIKRISK